MSLSKDTDFVTKHSNGIIRKVRHSGNGVFLRALPLLSHFAIFFSNVPPPVSFTEMWQTLAQNRGNAFVYTAAQEYHIISKKGEKVKNYTFNCTYVCI